MKVKSELIFGRYEKRLLLGRGNFGNVWQCLDVKTNELIAIKEENPLRVNKATLLN